MKTIAHISDLHFGTEDPVLAEALAADLQQAPPSLLVVSGDFTQRARRSQFKAARDFLDRLPHPQLVIPGNHDIPLYDVVRRFSSPLGRYKKFIESNLNPTYVDDALLVIGLDTTRAYNWKSGGISEEQMRFLADTLGAAGSRFKIVVTHHPFIPSPVNPNAESELSHAAEALALLENHEVDLVLAGHLHHGYSGDTRAHFRSARRSIISVQAGTAISRRVRHQEPNAYNWIQISEGNIRVEVRAWNSRQFRPLRIAAYKLEVDAWLPVLRE
ncbi:MAG TPA: metallophosphoesterase [Opitutaceae bacterium]|nr:metallophosphoesterase [Opitutaceae bacterium]